MQLARESSLRFAIYLERAYRNFFRNPQTGFPRLKSKHRNQNRYTTNVVNGNIMLEEGRLKLPKLGKVRIRQVLCNEYDPGENQAGKCSYGQTKILGIDYAMHGMALFSDELTDVYPGYLRQAEEKLAREQRKLSHCERGSRNYGKQKRKVALCHEKVKNQRKDYIHKLTRKIADEYDVVGVEDIDMKAMSRCLHFGKSVMDNSYGMFRDILGYKLEEQGKRLVKVDRFFCPARNAANAGM